MNSNLSEAGIRSPGKYCGVVIYDRWDGCILYNAVYVMYISDNVKEGLRNYAGQDIQIDAINVFQPKNPGDGRINKFEYIGSAPENHNWVKTDGVILQSSVKVGENGKPIATIIIKYSGKDSINLFAEELGLTLLTRNLSKHPWFVADGPSFALITRQDFEIDSLSPYFERKGITNGVQYSWTIGQEYFLPHKFTLGPGEIKQIQVKLNLPDGEYDFLCGYGAHGGRTIASNLFAFDINKAVTKLVKIQSR